MKIEAQVIEVETSGLLDEETFSIDGEDMGFIFSILRSKIYSNPIQSICREIASNARDANREAGKGNIPVKITLSNKSPLVNNGGLHICFEDEGPGISPDRMKNVFLKYGKSTKRESNDFTGGFGMGCKTPFAYTDAFNVTTICNGIKYFYSIYIDDSQKGKMALLHKQETDLPNGTSIIIPVLDHDKSSFESGVITSCSFWEQQPIIKGFSSDFVSKTVVLKGQGYSIIQRNTNYSFFNKSTLILIDGIIYPYEHNVLDARGFTVLLEFNNGELTLSVNREQLQYDDSTNQKLKARIEQIETELKALAEKRLEGKSIREQVSVYSNWLYPRTGGIGPENEFIGKVVEEKFPLVIAKTKALQAINYLTIGTSILSIPSDKTLYYADKYNREKAEVVGVSNVFKPKALRKPTLPVNPTPEQEVDYKRQSAQYAVALERQQKELLFLYDYFTLQPLSLVQTPKKEKVVKEHETIKVWSVKLDSERFSQISYTYDLKKKELVDGVNNNVLFIPVSKIGDFRKYNANSNSADTQTCHFFATLKCFLSLLPSNFTHVFFIKNEDLKYFPTTVIENQIGNLEKIAGIKVMNEIYNNLVASVKCSTLRSYLNVPKDFKPFLCPNIDERKKINRFHVSRAGLEYLAKYYNLTEDPNIEKAKEYLGSFYKKYPLLKRFNLSVDSLEEQKQINEYIELINNK